MSLAGSLPFAPAGGLFRTGTYFGCSLPAQFAGIEIEYRIARDRVALLDAGFYAVAEFTGPDRVRYLNAITTNDVKSLALGAGNIGLLLSPQGRILAELATLALESSHLVLSHAMARQRTHETLEKFIILDDVTLTDRTSEFGALLVEGAGAPVFLRQLCGAELEAMAEHAHAEISAGEVPCRLVRRSHFGRPGALLLAPRESLGALWSQLADAARAAGGGPVGWEAANSLRLEAGMPWFGRDFDDSVIPHEAGLEDSHISFTKGCYTGQEIVERVRSRGQVNRRRVSLRFDSEAPPALPARLLADGKEVGRVTSAGYSFAARTAIGMGYVRREQSAPGQRLTTSGSVAAEVFAPPL
jgi:aminomethyltransferase